MSSSRWRGKATFQAFTMRCTIALLAALVLIAPCVQAAEQLQKEVTASIDGYSGYKVLFRTGAKIEGSKLPIATLTDMNGEPIKVSPNDKICTSNNCYDPTNLTRSANPDGYEISPNPDFISLHEKNGKVFVVAQFEAPNPAALYIIEVEQASDGSLTPIAATPTNWAEWGGLWVPCAGSVTPWDTHAGGEEYEPDAYCIDVMTSIDGDEETSLKNCTGDPEHILDMMRFFGLTHDGSITAEQVKEYFNPYKYGHAFEVALSDDGSPTLGKHYTMGRHSYEMWYVMPDSKTVYATDDGTNTAFWKFVMDTAGDMSVGTLYGAKMHQTTDEYGGEFDIEWIELGHGTHDEIYEMVWSDNITFSDIFEAQPYEDGCAEGFTSISKRDNDMGAMCLKLKDGMETAAAFLESRRYLAYLNGTVEFNKWEGFTFDPETNNIYTAMSVVAKGMENNQSNGKNSTKYDEGGPNDVRLPANPCGCVYVISVDDEFNALNMKAELCGMPNVRGPNECDVASISEPDNVAFITGQGALIIGEDTNANQNDIMWIYVPATGELTRILSSPYGAETTSPYWFPNIGGHAYLMTAMQHPYAERDNDRLTDAESSGVEGWVGAWAVNASNFANSERLRFVGIPSATTNLQKHSVLVSDDAYLLTQPEMYTQHGVDGAEIIMATVEHVDTVVAASLP